MSAEIEPARLAVLAVEIREEVAAADRDFQSAVDHAIAAGEKLIEAKALVRRGEWGPWLDANFPGGEHTARNYMRLARNRERVLGSPSIRQAVALLAEPREPAPEPEPPDAFAEVKALVDGPPVREDYVRDGDLLGGLRFAEAVIDHSFKTRRAAANALIALADEFEEPIASAARTAGTLTLAYIELEDEAMRSDDGVPAALLEAMEERAAAARERLWALGREAARAPTGRPRSSTRLRAPRTATARSRTSSRTAGRSPTARASRSSASSATRASARTRATAVRGSPAPRRPPSRTRRA
jgi:hypothetical protein